MDEGRSVQGAVAAARSVLQLGDPSSAIGLLEQARAFAPRDAEVLTLLARAHGLAAGLEGQIRFLEELRGLALPELVAALGERYLDAGRVEEGRRLLEDATRQAPDDPRAWRGLGRARELSGDLAGAAAAYLAALERLPADGGAAQDLAAVFVQLGRPADALRIYRGVLRERPADAQAAAGERFCEALVGAAAAGGSGGADLADVSLEALAGSESGSRFGEALIAALAYVAWADREFQDQERAYVLRRLHPYAALLPAGATAALALPGSLEQVRRRSEGLALELRLFLFRLAGELAAADQVVLDEEARALRELAEVLGLPAEMAAAALDGLRPISASVLESLAVAARASGSAAACQELLGAWRSFWRRAAVDARLGAEGLRGALGQCWATIERDVADPLRWRFRDVGAARALGGRLRSAVLRDPAALPPPALGARELEPLALKLRAEGRGDLAVGLAAMVLACRLAWAAAAYAGLEPCPAWRRSEGFPSELDAVFLAPQAALALQAEVGRR